MKHDKPLDLAVGNSRKTKTWKNKTMLWSELLDRLSRVTRTPETVAEYKAMTRNQQSEIKDVGGFVGGYCNNGNRSDVRHRSILCLDADYADAVLWPQVLADFDCAAAVYSTHKHTPEKPRLRLVIPLARNVDPDEYQAIGRRVADTLGIDKFDDTSYQPQRLMYWPSCSQDGAYFFDSKSGDFLNPDKILATYHNWRDVSSWPMSSRVAEVVKRAAAQQKDPTEKGGIVGAFCRTYTLTEAIEAFIPTYVPCDEPNRYTYTEGSTAAGVVVYEDKWSYSHHATDPASGQLVNAWDLVRLHKFGQLDLDCAPDTPTSSRPSYKAMAELVSKDQRVTAQVVADRMAEARADLDEPMEDDTAPTEDWRTKLKITEKGTLAQTIENTVIILRHDPDLSGRLALNEMDHNIVTRQSLPWRSVTTASQWTDTDDAALRYHLERVYGLTGKDRIFDATNVVASENKFHPVRDYLNGCTWDGVPRVETLLIDYMGAEDNEYTRAVTKKTLAAAVARVFTPGCKFDYMLTLRGRQGIGKSTLIAKLGGDWFSDSFISVQGKEAYEQVLGVWIMEVGELAGMRKAEEDAIKLYVSKQADRFRPAYGRRTQEYPRQCIFIGTTNEGQFLRDPTGGRRFWVVDTPNDPTRDMWTELTPEMIKLIWGEAVELFKRGETLFLPPALEAIARDVQAAHAEENPKAGLVAEYLDRLLPEDWATRDAYDRRAWLESGSEGTVRRTTVCTAEIWAEALGGNPERLDRLGLKEISAIMSNQPEWRYQGSRVKTVPPYGRQRYYERRLD